MQTFPDGGEVAEWHLTLTSMGKYFSVCLLWCNRGTCWFRQRVGETSHYSSSNPNSTIVPWMTLRTDPPWTGLADLAWVCSRIYGHYLPNSQLTELRVMSWEWHVINLEDWAAQKEISNKQSWLPAFWNKIIRHKVKKNAYFCWTVQKHLKIFNENIVFK